MGRHSLLQGIYLTQESDLGFPALHAEALLSEPKPMSICAVLSSSVVPDSATPWTVAYQAPLSVGILQARILEWDAVFSFKGSFQPRDQTHITYVSCIDIFTMNATWEAS